MSTGFLFLITCKRRGIVIFHFFDGSYNNFISVIRVHLNDAGIRLTPNGAMTPHAAVCGLMIAHPAAQYFAIGKIDRAQLCDYAARRGAKPDEIERFLAKNIG